MKIIIYPRTDGGICIVRPFHDILKTEADIAADQAAIDEHGFVADDGKLTIEQIAAKDVPTGRPYRIINETDLPADKYFRDAWEADFSEPDGRGADHGTTEAEGA